jgi:hypothetical protein
MNRIKKYISAKISSEIGENTIDNWHGINKNNIAKHLIPPLLETYFDPISENTKYRLWTVLEELPEEKSGYTIFYDAEKDEFGLGMHGDSGKMFSLGIYGPFIEALNGM